MLIAEIDWHTFVSFWGSIASIVGLSVTAAAVAWSKIRKRIRRGIGRLENAQRKIVDKTTAAKTQGRRMDLFIYQQSIFSSLRFELIMCEICYWALYVLMLTSTLQAMSVPPPRIILPIAAIGALIVIGFFHFRLFKERVKIKVLSDTFIEELEKFL